MKRVMLTLVGLSTLAPGLTPSHANSTSVPMIQYWFPLSLHDPILLTASIFSTLSQQRARWLMKNKPDGLFFRHDQKWIELSYMAAITMISKSLQHPENVLTDTLVLCVLILAELATSEEYALEIFLGRDSPFDVPFKSLQWVDVYSSLPPNTIHVEGLIKIIKLKGGLENIKLPCLASIISLYVLDFTLSRVGANSARLQIRFDSFQSMVSPSTLSIHLLARCHVAKTE